MEPVRIPNIDFTLCNHGYEQSPHTLAQILEDQERSLRRTIYGAGSEVRRIGWLSRDQITKGHPKFFFCKYMTIFFLFYLCIRNDRFSKLPLFFVQKYFTFLFYMILRILLPFQISCSIFLFIIKINFRVIFSPSFQLNRCCIVYKRISLVILRCLLAKYIIAILFEVH